MRRKTAMVVIVLLLLLVGACAPQAGSPTPTPAGTVAVPKATSGAVSVATPKPAVEKPQRGGTLTVAMDGEPRELDPHKGTSGMTRRWARLLYNTLVMTDKNGDIVPELAESWSYPDPNTLVMKLRKGVKFHDGTDFNAQAVKFNLERIMDPATKALRRMNLDAINLIKVVDDYTVQFSLKAPQASLLSILTDTMAGGMISPASVKKWGDETLTHPVGTGPFEFVEWVKGDHMTAKRFDGYWRKDEDGNQLPYLDQVIIKPIPDASVILTNLRTGAADLIGPVLPAQLPILKADSSLKTFDWGNSLFDIFLNCSQPPFDNKALRQALAWAVDREAIHKAIYGDTGVPARYQLDPASWAFDPTSNFYTRDLARAREKLTEGGKPNGFKFEAKDYNTDLELRVAQAIKGQLAEVGIDMEIVPVEVGQLAAQRIAAQYEAIFSISTGLPGDPDEVLYQSFHSKGTGNYAKCVNAQVDELLEKARQIYDKGERKALYAKIQTLVIDDSPKIFVHHDRITSAMNQKVMGFTPNINLFGLQLDWLWLKK